VVALDYVGRETHHMKMHHGDEQDYSWSYPHAQQDMCDLFCSHK
jgi:hypothetical protein